MDVQALHVFDGLAVSPGSLLEFEQPLESPFGFLVPTRITLELLEDLDEDGCAVFELTNQPSPSDDFRELVRQSFVDTFGAPPDEATLDVIAEATAGTETRVVGRWDAATGYFRSVESVETITAADMTQVSTTLIVDVTEP